jgi:hypothetical protein
VIAAVLLLLSLFQRPLQTTAHYTPRPIYIQRLSDPADRAAATSLLGASSAADAGVSSLLAHDGYLADKSQVWMKRPPELERPLGPPKGPAIRDGYIYTREFAHEKVRLDIEKQIGEIEWIEPETGEAIEHRGEIRFGIPWWHGGAIGGVGHLSQQVDGF